MKDMAQWVCIDNRGVEKELSLNKVYREIRSEYMEIGLIVLFNEIGFVSEYYNGRFVSMQEWRQERLKKIGI
jgi:hypothetical protein